MGLFAAHLAKLVCKFNHQETYADTSILTHTLGQYIWLSGNFSTISLVYVIADKTHCTRHHMHHHTWIDSVLNYVSMRHLNTQYACKGSQATNIMCVPSQTSVLYCIISWQYRWSRHMTAMVVKPQIDMLIISWHWLLSLTWIVRSSIRCCLGWTGKDVSPSPTLGTIIKILW